MPALSWLTVYSEPTRGTRMNPLLNFNTNMEVASSPKRAASHLSSVADPQSADVRRSNSKRHCAAKKISFSERNIVGKFPRFILLKRSDGDFSSVSPFAIDKCIRELVGHADMIRKVPQGLVVEVQSSIQSSKLLETKHLCGFVVNASPHPTLNYSKGVINCRDLLNCTVEEILEGLRDQGVTDVKRLCIFREGVRVNTASCVLTFNSPKIPEKIRAGFHLLPVRLYIPSPLRCYRCQMFGHSAVRCNRSQICVCGSPPHVGSACSQPIICPNCGGPHSAKSKICPIYMQESEIQRLKVTERLSYTDAKRMVSNSYGSKGTYSQVASSTTKNSSSTAIDAKDLASRIIPDLLHVLRAELKTLVKDAVSASCISNQDAVLPQEPMECNPSTSLEENSSVASGQCKTVVPRTETFQDLERGFTNIMESISRVTSPAPSDSSRLSATKNRRSSTSLDEHPPQKKRTPDPTISDYYDTPRDKSETYPRLSNSDVSEGEVDSDLEIFTDTKPTMSSSILTSVNSPNEGKADAKKEKVKKSNKT